jgi:acetyl-CoA acetyltransferase
MTRNDLRGKVAVIGIGMSPVGKVPGKSPLWLAADAAKKALADAGIRKSEVDGVLSSHAMASPFHRFNVAFSEYFGIRPTFSNTLQVSGATAATQFNIGAAAIHGGLAEVVLVVAGDSLLSGLTPEMALRSLTESRDQHTKCRSAFRSSTPLR